MNKRIGNQNEGTMLLIAFFDNERRIVFYDIMSTYSII
jgi:hypothetical protein